MIINRNASVVEIGTFRQILCALKLGCSRERDRIQIYPTSDGVLAGREYVTPYATQEVQGAPIRTMDVDEGFFSYVLYDSPLSEKGIAPYSGGWMELVDFCDTLSLMVKVLDHEFKPQPCDFIGQGRRKEHYSHEFFERLLELQEANPTADYSLSNFELV